jgi:hypothetical protein
MVLAANASRNEVTGVLVPHYHLRRSAAVTTVPSAAR